MYLLPFRAISVQRWPPDADTFRINNNDASGQRTKISYCYKFSDKTINRERSHAQGAKLYDAGMASRRILTEVGKFKVKGKK